MNKTWTILIVVLLLTAPALAGDIYTWTDEKGVKRFSDRPPEGVEHFEKIEGSVSSTQSDDAMRPGLQKLLDEVKAQNREDDLRKAREAAARKEAQERAAEAEKEARIDAERQRLQKRIDELNGRALSPTFTQGMRDSQIKEIQKQIDALGQPKQTK